jgi:hypothetical protein
VSIFTASLLIIFILVVLPILYWIGLGVRNLIRHLGRGA